jgi:hypothetical protein
VFELVGATWALSSTLGAVGTVPCVDVELYLASSATVHLDRAILPVFKLVGAILFINFATKYY